MLSAETTKAMMQGEPINAKMITSKFYGTATNISIVQRYASTSASELEDKAEFYPTENH